MRLAASSQTVQEDIMSTNTTATRALRLPVAATETTCGQCGYLGRGTEAASCALFRKIVGDAHGDPQRLAECRAAETVESAESADLAYWRKEAGRLQTIVGAVCELARSGQESAIDAVRRVVLDNVNLRNELSELRAVRERAVYFVDCSTGCSCCQGEDHERGPFSSRAIAEARAKQYRAAPLLTSQYAPRGMYLVCERKAEVLPDERLVVDGRVYDKLVDCVPAGDDAEKCPA